MPFVDAEKNVMLDALAARLTHASLHTGYPSTTGANEATGGSPAYARKAKTWNAAASGNLDDSDTPVFDVPAGTYSWVGFWSALSAGTYRGCVPLGATAPKNFNVDDIATDVFDCEAHGYADTNQVVFWAGSGALPGGFTQGTSYFVRDATTDSFKLALTSGGTAIDVSSIGNGLVQRIIPETFAGQGTLTLTDTDIDLGLVVLT